MGLAYTKAALVLGGIKCHNMFFENLFYKAHNTTHGMHNTVGDLGPIQFAKTIIKIIETKKLLHKWKKEGIGCL